MRKRACGISALIAGQISLQKYSTASTFGSQSMAPTKVMRGADDASGFGSEVVGAEVVGAEVGSNPAGSEFAGSNLAGSGRYCARSTPVGTTVTRSASTHCIMMERSFAETAITCWNLRTTARS